MTVKRIRNHGGGKVATTCIDGREVAIWKEFGCWSVLPRIRNRQQSQYMEIHDFGSGPRFQKFGLAVAELDRLAAASS